MLQATWERASKGQMLQPNYQHFNRLKVRPIFMRSRAGFGGLLYTNRIIWPIRWATEQLQCFESVRGILEALTKCLSHDISLIKVGRGSAQCRIALRSVGRTGGSVGLLCGRSVGQVV